MKSRPHSKDMEKSYYLVIGTTRDVCGCLLLNGLASIQSGVCTSA